jgi:hypothetical protein
VLAVVETVGVRGLEPHHREAPRAQLTRTKRAVAESALGFSGPARTTVALVPRQLKTAEQGLEAWM